MSCSICMSKFRPSVAPLANSNTPPRPKPCGAYGPMIRCPRRKRKNCVKLSPRWSQKEAVVRPIEQQAAQAYREQFREEPVLVASAPGRVNLIGEHTDYNGGFVLPCAVDRRVAVAVGHGETQLYSANFQERRQLLGKREGSWADYPSGVVWAMKEQGYEVLTFRGAFAGDVPLAGGLSSSAAIEAATALALDEFFQFRIPKKDLAVLCQHAENAYVGVNSGIMDQYASLMCQAGMALLIDS